MRPATCSSSMTATTVIRSAQRWHRRTSMPRPRHQRRPTETPLPPGVVGAGEVTATRRARLVGFQTRRLRPRTPTPRSSRQSRDSGGTAAGVRRETSQPPPDALAVEALSGAATGAASTDAT